jgi:Zn-dependent protease with chaperone function
LPLLPRKRFSLLLPLSAIDMMGQSALETLLAIGLARSHFTYNRSYMSRRILYISPIVVSSLLLLILWMHGLWFIGIPIAILCWCSSWLLLNAQKRKMILVCDARAVQWLGRERVCQGLHALADSSRAPYHEKWGEPSLAERIEHVCGTRIAVNNSDLTLVR